MTVENDLSAITGTYELSARRSLKIARSLAYFMPLFIIATWAAFYKGDTLYSVFFLGTLLLLGSIAATLFFARHKTQYIHIGEAGIEIGPVGFQVPAASIAAVEKGKTIDGKPLFFFSLKHRHFLPYFGTAWSFGEVLVVNTE